MRSRLIFKFLFPILIIFVVTAFILFEKAEEIIRNEMIERAQVLINDFVQLQTTQHVANESNFSLTDTQKTEQIFGSLEAELKTREVLRIKVWDKYGTVIYSDNKEIVGKNFSDNAPFQEAIGGNIAADIKKPTEPENIDVVGYGQLMEVYVPVFLEDERNPAGVVELYYTMDFLNQNIRQAQISILGIIGVAFVVIDILLIIFFWFIILKPLFNLNKTATLISQGKLSQRAESVSKDEIGQLAGNFNKMTESLLEARRLPESILQSMKDGLFVVDVEGNITDINEAALSALGYAKEELVGKPVSIVFEKIANAKSQK